MKAILFGGQGSQIEGMGKDFYEQIEFAKDYYDSLDAKLVDLILNADLKTISQTPNTQPALLTYQTMVLELLRSEGIDFDYSGGLSIGEYSALVQAQVLEPKEAIEIGKIRGRLMDEAVQGIDTKMLAVLAIDKDLLEEKVKEVSTEDSKVEISNRNCPGQIVVSGHKDAVDRLEAQIKDHAKRLIELNTSGPFHTSYMDSVEEDLLEVFEDYEFKDEEIPVVYNYLGRPRKEDEVIKNIMAKQVSNTVRFEEVLQYMVDQGVKTFVEVGFGGVIKGFLRRIDRKLDVYEIDSVENYRNFLKELASNE